MKDFYRLLEEYLEYDGYEIIEQKSGKTVVKKDDEVYSLIIAGPVVHEDDLLKLEESTEERVLITTEEIPSETREAIPKDTEIWGRETLIQKFGELVLEKSTLEGIAEGKEGIKGPEKDFEVDIEHDIKEGILKPVIDFDEVTELGEKLAGGFKYRLELVPHYLFRFKISGDEEKEGKLYLNAVSGESNFWKGSFEIISELKKSHVKLEPNIPEEKSEEKAEKAIQEEYSEQKEKKWEEESATIVEKIREGPAEEDIDLDYKGIVNVPMWAVEGTDGIVVINAARGKIEREL